MSAAAASGDKRPLDDVMLAMDVVDTLRHRSQMVERELSEEGRDQALKDRLRKIYASQGIEVPDHVIAEGVRALKEDRFVYTPPRNSLQLRLAQLYVNRGQWGKWVITAILGIVALALAYLMLVAWPRAALPGKIDAMHREVLTLAAVEPARTRAEKLHDSATDALRKEDQDQARAALSGLTQLRDRLEQAYRLDIVTGPGEQSGIWRESSDSSAHNYYIIVEASDAAGNPVDVLVDNEETGKQARVSRWAVRVDAKVFRQIAQDKQDDGIIQGRRFGEKQRGHLTPDYNYPTRDATITDWSD